jgi:integrase
MSVRKRKWTNAKGVEQEAWIVDYVDIKGTRRLKTFSKKKEADAFAAKASIEVKDGTHVADSASSTVRVAGEFWIASGEGAHLERSTINQRKRHLKYHIDPFIGDSLLSKLTVPTVRAFEDRLREEGRSAAMLRKVLGSLGSILTDAQERGLTVRNPVKDMRGTRRNGNLAEKRKKGKLVVGVDIPAPEEVRALLGAMDGHWRPLLLTAVFTGMRSSELRGLRWQDVDFQAKAIHVRQRADEFGEIGAPKSKAGTRTIPVPPIVINTLREWSVRATHDLVFANPNGEPRSHTNIINKGLIPAMLKAGVVTGGGKAKYTGLHSLRHFYASWLINRKEDGGLGLPAKAVQERLGHGSIVMTMDVYGHLFPRGDDSKELEEAATALLG